MRKTYHILFIVSMTTVPIVQAQILSNVNWGTVGSLSNTNLGLTKPFTRYSTTGYKIGIFSSKRLNSKYEASLALNFSRYGGKSYNTTRIVVPPFADSTSTVINTDRLSYLNLNPEIRYYPLNSGNVKPFVGFGIFVGYLISSKRYNATLDGQVFNIFNQRRFFYKTNYGVHISTGLKFAVGKKNKVLITSISYEKGLYNTEKNVYYTGYFMLKNTNSISLTAFYELSNLQ